MPESGEWFSPRTRPEMLTSDDPPVPGDKPELVRILPGPATPVGRATVPLRRLVGVVPAIGRRIVRVDADQPSRWQLVGMWTSGSAIVAATALAVATVVGGAPSVLTQPFEQLAGLPGRWFTAPAAPVQDQLLRDGHAAEDAALDIGDSAVLECIGLGGMAVAAAPAVAAFFGGGAADAAARSRLMGEICAGRSARFTLPALDHAGSPVGIDARLVVELGVGPQITTGVLHATDGAGQIGAGIAHQPLEPFAEALTALVGRVP